jgi:hypothetical protein
MFWRHSIIVPMPSLSQQGTAHLHASVPCTKRRHNLLVTVLYIVGAAVAITKELNAIFVSLWLAHSVESLVVEIKTRGV